MPLLTDINVFNPYNSDIIVFSLEWCPGTTPEFYNSDLIDIIELIALLYQLYQLKHIIILFPIISSDFIIQFNYKLSYYTYYIILYHYYMPYIKYFHIMSIMTIISKELCFR
jgi:hypothetical protein